MSVTAVPSSVGMEGTVNTAQRAEAELNTPVRTVAVLGTPSEIEGSDCGNVKLILGVVSKILSS